MPLYTKLSFITGSILLFFIVLSFFIGGSTMWTTAYACGWVFLIALVWELRHIWNNRRPSDSDVRKMRELVLSML